MSFHSPLSTTPTSSTPSSAAASSSSFESYWRDDFKPLQDAGKAVLEALREDEMAPDADLYRRILSSGQAGSHLYFIGDSSTCSLEHRRTVPLPPYLKQQLQTTRLSTFMGILPEAQLVWMSVDDKVYLWSCSNVSSDTSSSSNGSYIGSPPTANGGAGTEGFCAFAIPSGQCVVSVGLVPPKKGVFKESVEWCIIVTTPEEVILCALARTHPEEGMASPGFRHGTGTLRLVPTRYVIPTDSVAMLCVCGTPNGRILLGGNDGALYEMDYQALVATPPLPPTNAWEDKLNQFYNGNKPFPKNEATSTTTTSTLVHMGKRTLSSVLPTSFDSQNGRKCRKFNHSSSPSVMKAIVPDFLRRAGAALVGSSSSISGGPIVQMVHDKERSCLYTLSSKGWICAFDLGSGKETKMTALVDTEKTARLYLDAVSRGKMYPPSTSHSSSLATIAFPGGGSSALAGVGGMDGARSISRIASSEKDSARRQRGANSPNTKTSLTPVSLHVISRRESARLTLVAITAGGLRYYLSSLASNVVQTGPRPHLDSNRKTDPLAPSHKFTLLYVRAPPAVVGDTGTLQDSSAVDPESASGVEGYLPRMALTSSKEVSHTDAAFYENGVMVLALEHKTRENTSTTGASTTTSSSRFVGDVIVASAPDSVARKKVATTLGGTTSEGQQQRVETKSAPGGVSEALSLPMTMSAPSAAAHAPVLPGGRVHAICSTPSEQSAVLRLTLCSQTPTDSELGVGLVPAFVRPTASSSSRSRPSPPNSTAIVSTGNGSSSTASMTSVTLLLLKNFMLSRPLREGLVYKDQTLRIGAGSDRYDQPPPRYRISTRYGCGGFSTTAGGKVTGSGTRVSVARSEAAPTSKSARLSPWLLRPSVVPLNPLALQHLLTSEEMVALNTGGMHFFTFKSILTNLAEALMAPGLDVARDDRVSQFFTNYGYAQSCAMCLSLAVGCGPASSEGHYGSELKSRARRAALSRAHKPRLIRKDDSSIVSVVGDDAAIPPGYDFKPSSLYQGLTSLLSRLLRPIWYKPGVVVTEGQVKQIGGMRKVAYPAKVELLLDDSSLEAVLKPLNALLAMMKEVFPPAVSIVPGVQRSDGDVMEVDENYMITGTMQYQGYVQNRLGGLAGARDQLNAREAEALSHLIEERNMHSLYRLLARAVQLIKLLSLLHRAHSMPELCGVEWGMLHGLTVAQLVKTKDGHERIENLLNTLVSRNLSPNTSVTPSADADQLANFLASECYLYFSPGSRLAYAGFRYANEAISCAPTSARRSVLANQASVHLKQAARYWYSAPLISGQILHTSNNEDYEKIALRATQHESPLAKAAAVLMQLRDVEGVVEVCLTVASNFGGRHIKSNAANGLTSGYQSEMLPWERNLYHKRLQERGINQTGGQRSLSVAPTSPTVVGAGVTSKDAQQTCHAIVFHHLSAVLDSSESDLALKMVNACAVSSDQTFKNELYEHLCRTHQEYFLFKIRNKDLEVWLKKRENVELLWHYYTEQGNDEKAGEVMYKHACGDKDGLTLDERSTALWKAQKSYESALQLSPALSVSTARQVELERVYQEIREKLDVAELQNRVYQAVRATSLESKLDEEKLSKLKSSLISVSDLYNEYAIPLMLFDISLLILHSCGHNDATTIELLWKSVLCDELLPCSTANPETYQFLQSLMADSMLQDTVTLVAEDTTSSSAPSFDKGEWIENLKSRVIDLGKELQNGSDFCFPVAFLTSTLEGLRCAQLASGFVSSRTTPWPLQILSQVGVSYMAAFNAYDQMTETQERQVMGGVDAQHRVVHLYSIVQLLDEWLAVASAGIRGTPGSNGSSSDALRELRRSAGFLKSRIDSFKFSLDSLGDEKDILDLKQRLQEIETTMERIA